MSIEHKRRNFLKIGASAAGAALLFEPLSKAFGAACGLTPPQTPGPFYPGESQFHSDNDLTLIPGHSIRAEGQVIYVKGKVVDANCNPIEYANVEIWQACASGKYNNPRDPNKAPLDPHFKYWAETFTDSKGEYWFKTILPGEYPADEDWIRPPHIHFKITRLGYRELVTQMYFKGSTHNDNDLILKQIAAEERDSVIVDFQPSPSDLELGSLIGYFDITLRKVR
jgi:protocatechuate 3,4-dioxygenase beta subunit